MDTDACYNACAAMLLAQVRADVDAARVGEPPALGVLFGTHNWKSCDLILEQLVKLGLANSKVEGTVWLPDQVTERVAIGQLYGAAGRLVLRVRPNVC